MKPLITFVLVLGILVFTATVFMATNYYASPTGSGSTCSFASPCSLTTLLAKSTSTGDQLYLRGGTYSGKFTSTLTAGTVQSYSGEWAKIDGYVNTTLSSNIDASVSSITVGDASRFPVPSVICFHDQATEGAEEQMQVGGVAGNVVTVNRGWNGTTALTHTAGALIVLGGNQLTINGSDTIYRDFEIMNSDPVRTWGATNNGQNGPHLRGSVVHTGARTKLINLIIHDGDGGIFGGPASVDSETYGCIIYNGGYRHNTNDPAGHGWYIQNNPGSTKTYRDDVVFNNEYFGFQEESVSGNTVNIINDGIIMFGHLGLVGAQSGIVDNISITNSMGYFRYSAGSGPDGFRLGYAGSNGSITVTGNYIAEVGGKALSLNSWSSATVTGNTFVTKGTAINTAAAYTTGLAGGITWNNNQYYDMSTTVTNCFPPPDSRAIFSYNGQTDACVNQTFAQWRTASGYDAAATDLGLNPPTTEPYFYTQTLPTTAKVFVRPNQYQAGRAHIVIYNWPLSSTVSVSLATTGLVNGQTYEIRYVPNYFGGAVLTGTYNSGSPSVNIPMNGLTIAQPLGTGLATRTDTAPEFGVFVVLPTSAASGGRPGISGRASVLGRTKH